jgi:hypothetical protein
MRPEDHRNHPGWREKGANLPGNAHELSNRYQLELT